MNSQVLKNYFLITLSFVLWLVITAIPMGKTWVSIKPDFIVLVTIYWVTFLPNAVGITYSFIIGLILDLLLSNPLGSSSLGLSLVAYLANFLRFRLNSTCLWQQALAILGLVGSYKIIVVWANLFSGMQGVNFMTWVSIISSMLFWPIVYIFMHYFRNIINIR